MSHIASRAQQWCLQRGLLDVAELGAVAQELAAHLGLKPLEQRRLSRCLDAVAGRAVADTEGLEAARRRGASAVDALRLASRKGLIGGWRKMCGLRGIKLGWATAVAARFWCARWRAGKRASASASVARARARARALHAARAARVGKREDRARAAGEHARAGGAQRVRRAGARGATRTHKRGAGARARGERRGRRAQAGGRTRARARTPRAARRDVGTRRCGARRVRRRVGGGRAGAPSRRASAHARSAARAACMCARGARASVARTRACASMARAALAGGAREPRAREAGDTRRAARLARTRGARASLAGARARIEREAGCARERAGGLRARAAGERARARSARCERRTCARGARAQAWRLEQFPFPIFDSDHSRVVKVRGLGSGGRLRHRGGGGRRCVPPASLRCGGGIAPLP